MGISCSRFSTLHNPTYDRLSRANSIRNWYFYQYG